MQRKFIKFISRSTLVESFLKTPSPQWVVFTVDVLIVLLATLLTLTFDGNSANNQVGWQFSIWTKSAATLLVYVLAMLIMRPFCSIVRLSTFEDTYRVGMTVLIASVVIGVCELTIDYFFLPMPYVGIWTVFVIGVLVFAMQVSLRLIIKYIYRITQQNGERTRVVVLGSAINSYALSTALMEEVNGNFEPVLMLSLNSRNVDSRVNGIPIKKYDPLTVPELFRQYNSDTLLFLSTQIDFIRSVADVFLSCHIKLLMLNQVEELDVNADTGAKLSTHVQDIKIEDLLGRDPINTDNPNIAETLRDHTIMVTGAAGSIGSELVRQVASYNPGRIILVDQAETPMHELQLEMEAKYPKVDIKLCIADIVNERRMNQIFDRYRPQIVYHAAAYKHVPMMERNPVEAVHTNVFGTKMLADLSMTYGVQRFVMVSTDKAVNPTNVMGASKRIAEIYVQSLANTYRNNPENHTRFITTRFGNVLGSNGSVIPLFRKQIAAGGPVTVTHKDIIRYFMTIPEAVSLVLEAGHMGHGGEIFVFDMGEPVRIYDLARRMISLAGMRPNVDINIIETGLRPGEKLYEELLNEKEQTTATHHKKIMIAKVRVYNYAEVCQRLQNLYELMKAHNEHDVVAQMKRIVPEFKSQNSEFTAVDNEITDADSMHEITA